MKKGLAALGLGLSAQSFAASAASRTSFLPPPPGGGANPVRHLPHNLNSTLVDGLPFEPWFTGDDWASFEDIPFHQTYQGAIPSTNEEVEVAVVGGGLSGLTTAYLLRHKRPVLLELRQRFGGNAQGEKWRGTKYSMGSAYVITPDQGGFLHRFYRRLGLHHVKRESFPPDPMELNGVIEDQYWSGAGMSPAEQLAFTRYAEVVTFMAEEAYPEIPLPSDPKQAAFVMELDQRNFREDLEQRMGMPLTPLLAAGVQSYFYSSFGAGMEEISAASGWNFVAAEEFGRWVFPGGNSYIAKKLWRKLRHVEQHGPSGQAPMLRPDATVVDVRRDGDRFKVTWLDSSGCPQALKAEFVVMACSKHIAKYILHDLQNRDLRKYDAMQSIETMAYVVGNVLLNQPVQRDFYDIFMIGDQSFPMTAAAFEANPRPVDVTDGNYALPPSTPRTALTFYWPLPWFTARFDLVLNDPFPRYAQAMAASTRHALGLLNVPESAVEQIRMTRWGHAMPLAKPNLIANGTTQELLRPFDKQVFFVNQDNWALPAVENSLLDARSVARQIKALLNA